MMTAVVAAVSPQPVIDCTGRPTRRLISRIDPVVVPLGDDLHVLVFHIRRVEILNGRRSPLDYFNGVWSMWIEATVRGMPLLSEGGFRSVAAIR